MVILIHAYYCMYFSSQVSDDLSKIRRSPGIPLPDNTVEWQNDVNSRSVYIVSG